MDAQEVGVTAEPFTREELTAVRADLAEATAGGTDPILADHHMRTWPTLWRADRRLMERICPHGCGHPDPDDLAYHLRSGRDWVGVHGCDGCCADPTPGGEQ